MSTEKKQWINPEATEIEVNSGGLTNAVEDTDFSS